MGMAIQPIFGGKAWLPTEDDGYVSSDVQAGIELAKVCDLMAIEGRM